MDDRLPEEITLTLAEAAVVLFALDGALDVFESQDLEASQPETYRQLRDAVAVVQDKLLPDLGDL